MPDTMMQPEQTITRNRSPEIKDLAAALVKVQAKLEGAKKDAAAIIPGQKPRTYADLASVWDAIREPLTQNDLCIVQFPRTAGQGVEIETTLMHGKTGQFMSDVLWVPCGKHDAQGVGSAITYGRRYALMAVVGVCPVDDDGAAAVASAPQGQSGTAGGGGQFRPERRGNAMTAATDSIKEARRDIESGANGPQPAPKAATSTNGKKTPAEKAKEFTDEGIKFFTAHKDDEAACKTWWAENTKVPSGSSASPLAWLHKNFKDEHKRLQTAYEGVVGFDVGEAA